MFDGFISCLLLALGFIGKTDGHRVNVRSRKKARAGKDQWGQANRAADCGCDIEVLRVVLNGSEVAAGAYYAGEGEEGQPEEAAAIGETMAGGEEEGEEEAGGEDANFEDGDAVVVCDTHFIEVNNVDNSNKNGLI